MIDDLLVVRLKGVLTAAEQHPLMTLPGEKGRDFLKLVRSHLVETARSAMEAMIAEITGTRPMSLHHDTSTKTGEEVVLFTLSSAPLVRQTKKNSRGSSPSIPKMPWLVFVTRRFVLPPR